MQRRALAGFAPLIPCCMLRNCSLASKVTGQILLRVKGQFGFAQPSVPIESKGQSRGAWLVTSNMRAETMLLCLALHQRGAGSVNFTIY